MPSLPNYLRTNRKRTSFTQEEVAFLLGVTGIDRANKVSRDEWSTRIPTLETALAYELIYGKPVSGLFAGKYEEAVQEIAARVRVLRYRKAFASNSAKSQALGDIAARCAKLKT